MKRMQPDGDSGVAGFSQSHIYNQAEKHGETAPGSSCPLIPSGYTWPGDPGTPRRRSRNVRHKLVDQLWYFSD